MTNATIMLIEGQSELSKRRDLIVDTLAKAMGDFSSDTEDSTLEIWNYAVNKNDTQAALFSAEELFNQIWDACDDEAHNAMVQEACYGGLFYWAATNALFVIVKTLLEKANTEQAKALLLTADEEHNYKNTYPDVFCEAIEAGHDQVVELMLASAKHHQCLDLYKCDDVREATEVAVSSNHLKIVSLLLTHLGMAPNKALTFNANDLLYWAVGASIEMTKLIWSHLSTDAEKKEVLMHPDAISMFLDAAWSDDDDLTIFDFLHAESKKILTQKELHRVLKSVLFDETYALEHAAGDGHSENLKKLLTIVQDILSPEDFAEINDMTIRAAIDGHQPSTLNVAWSFKSNKEQQIFFKGDIISWGGRLDKILSESGPKSQSALAIYKACFEKGTTEQQTGIIDHDKTGLLRAVKDSRKEFVVFLLKKIEELDYAKSAFENILKKIKTPDSSGHSAELEILWEQCSTPLKQVFLTAMFVESAAKSTFRFKFNERLFNETISKVSDDQVKQALKADNFACVVKAFQNHDLDYEKYLIALLKQHHLLEQFMNTHAMVLLPKLVNSRGFNLLWQECTPDQRKEAYKANQYALFTELLKFSSNKNKDLVWDSAVDHPHDRTNMINMAVQTMFDTVKYTGIHYLWKKVVEQKQEIDVLTRVVHFTYHVDENTLKTWADKYFEILATINETPTGKDAFIILMTQNNNAYLKKAIKLISPKAKAVPFRKIHTYHCDVSLISKPLKYFDDAQLVTTLKKNDFELYRLAREQWLFRLCLEWEKILGFDPLQQQAQTAPALAKNTSANRSPVVAPMTYSHAPQKTKPAQSKGQKFKLNKWLLIPSVILAALSIAFIPATAYFILVPWSQTITYAIAGAGLLLATVMAGFGVSLKQDKQQQQPVKTKAAVVTANITRADFLSEKASYNGPTSANSRKISRKQAGDTEQLLGDSPTAKV